MKKTFFSQMDLYMLIDLSCQTLQIIEATKLQITAQDGRNLASFRIVSSFLREHLPTPTENSGPDLAGAGWSLININDSGQIVLKTYLLSLSDL
jgi:hypothetical protein